MLNRFYIALAFWVISLSALGLSASSLSQVLIGIVPLGIVFIGLLLYYVLPSNADKAPRAKIGR